MDAPDPLPSRRAPRRVIAIVLVLVVGLVVVLVVLTNDGETPSAFPTDLASAIPTSTSSETAPPVAGRYAVGNAQLVFSYPAGWKQEASTIRNFNPDPRIGDAATLTNGNFQVSLEIIDNSRNLTLERYRDQECRTASREVLRCGEVRLRGRTWLWVYQGTPLGGGFRLISIKAFTVVTVKIFRAEGTAPPGDKQGDGVRQIELILRSFAIRV